MKPSAQYEAKISAGALAPDPAQQAALATFDALYDGLKGYKPTPSWLLSGLFGVRPPRPKGIYFYGDVGRGKSMLMDLFYETAPVKRKRRVHFHAFMQEIHEGLKDARKDAVEDALKPVAQKIVTQASLLCFDELQITDITDAMIVGRLFEYLFEAGVIVVATSNRHPDDLYKNGLNRNLFLPFIETIKARLEIMSLDGETDHRQNKLAQEQRYFTPLTAANKIAMDKLWLDLAGPDPEPLLISVKKRQFSLPEFSNSVARAGFADLCEKPLGPGDYLEVASKVKALFLENVPVLSPAKNNEAKRFVTLIDALYEARVQLVMSAAAPPEALYEAGKGAFEFERTASRLREMQSDSWALDAN